MRVRVAWQPLSSRVDPYDHPRTHVQGTAGASSKAARFGFWASNTCAQGHYRACASSLPWDCTFNLNSEERRRVKFTDATVPLHLKCFSRHQNVIITVIQCMILRSTYQGNAPFFRSTYQGNAPFFRVKNNTCVRRTSGDSYSTPRQWKFRVRVFQKQPRGCLRQRPGTQDREFRSTYQGFLR